VREWLLHSPVQIAAGPEAGGIAGWLDANGRPAFAYGEITGYFLTWTAFVARTAGTTPALVARSERALAWLERRWRDGVPPTRCPVEPGADDWRNAAVFAFDLAMVVRGLSAAAGLLPAERCRAVAVRVLARLQEMVDADRGLIAIQPRAGADPRSLPDVWSTRPGPHLVKAAAAILCAGNLPVPGAVRAAAERTVDRWRDVPQVDGELHRLCYQLEGLSLLGRFDEAAAQRAEELVLRLAGGDAGAARGDVLAQALRLLAILRHRGALRGTSGNGTLAALRTALERHCDADGAVCFAVEGPLRHRNAWASMFADQALAWCGPDTAAQPLDPAEFRLLV
jgi:hypothetical protein